MPAGETESSPSPWTVDSLKEHIGAVIASVYQWAGERFLAHETLHNERFTAQEKAIKLALDAVERESQEREKAIEKSEGNIKDQLANVESALDRLTNQVTILMPRSEAEQRISQNTIKIDSLDARQREDTTIINSRLDLTQGSSTGLDKAWGYIIGAIGLAGTVIAIIISTR